MTAANDLKGVVAFLLADAGVAALVGNHVYGGELPQTEAALMPRGAIVVNDAGMGSGGGSFRFMNTGYLPIGINTKDLRCYGATPEAAKAVWLACREALKGIGLQGRVIAGGCLIYSVSLAGPIGLREPEVLWPLVWSTINVMAAETA